MAVSKNVLGLSKLGSSFHEIGSDFAVANLSLWSSTSSLRAKFLLTRMDVLNLKHDGGTKNANSFYHKGRLEKKVVHTYFWLKTWKSWFSAFFRWFFFAFLEVFLKVSFDPKSLKPWEWRIIIILGLDKSQNPKLVLKNKNAHKKPQKNGVVESPSEEATLKGHIFQSTWPIFPSFCRDIVQTSI